MKKAFTLIELLGVIVILGIIGVIVVPVVQGTINDSAIKSCEDQIKSFERAARNYANSNPYNIQNENVSLQTLIDKGYLEKKNLDNDGNIKNPKGGVFSIESTVHIGYDEGKYTYTYNGNC